MHGFEIEHTDARKKEFCLRFIIHKSQYSQNNFDNILDIIIKITSIWLSLSIHLLSKICYI
jgi:hypothetical protein